MKGFDLGTFDDNDNDSGNDNDMRCLKLVRNCPCPCLLPGMLALGMDAPPAFWILDSGSRGLHICVYANYVTAGTRRTYAQDELLLMLMHTGGSNFPSLSALMIRSEPNAERASL